MSDVRTYGALEYSDLGYGGAADYRPTFIVGILGIGPDGKPAWMDATCDVRTIRVVRGRSTALDAYAAGVATIEFRNFDGRYSAWTPNSIWADAARPVPPDGSIHIGPYRTGVPVSVAVSQYGESHTVFTGVTDSVLDTWPDVFDAVAIVQCTDGFEALATHERITPVTPVGAGERSGARINRLADDAAFAFPRRLDAGTVTLAATDLAGVSLDLMDAVREAEGGALYIDGDGALVFRQRDAAATDPRMTTVQWTLADNDVVGGCYTDLQLMADAAGVINTATITRAGGVPQIAVYQPSVDWYGPRSYSNPTALPYETDAQAHDLATFIVGQYSDNDKRVDAVTFTPDARRPQLWSIACGVRLLDRVRLVRTFPNGWQLDAELLTQGITHEISATGNEHEPTWTVTLNTSTAVLTVAGGEWDVATWDESEWGV